MQKNKQRKTATTVAGFFVKLFLCKVITKCIKLIRSASAVALAMGGSVGERIFYIVQIIVKEKNKKINY